MSTELHVIAPETPTKEMIRAALPWLESWSHMRATDRLNAIENAYRAMTKNLPSARAAISLAGESHE